MPEAVLFPGQGAQTVGMGRDLYEASKAAKAVFDLADRVLPFPLAEVIFEGPEESLMATDVSQPAIVAMSIAVVEAAREKGWRGADTGGATAGLSLGEYTALVFAGSLSLEDALVLVHKRGTYMREAGRRNPGGMLSVIGLDDGASNAVVAQASAVGVICAANLNCPGQVVLSGEISALEAAQVLAAEAGAMKTVMLKVDGAFHSPLMSYAAERLAAELDSVDIRKPSIPFIANATADFADDPGLIRELLVRQVTAPVLWEKSMRLLLARGMTGLCELGPGRVLTGLMKRIDRKAPMTAAGDMAGVEALAASCS